ncbi:hypothetical protein PR001_g18078 [Phytophthora rubi]|uniref:Thioredoxin domain-containing protein n=1 Tax=Phytophthora rubi TaxID=129364 RepID=A0A6A3KEE2_9STRA|nr:hypothetical protein PR001_g18078 [Phytophthora rubi]KAE9003589.1 hypothetical protein PR002_g17289 [Phytophthora rubi]
MLVTRACPTLKFFKVDVDAVKDYDGGRTSAEVEKWVAKKSDPAVKIVESVKELEEPNDVVLFVVVGAKEGKSRTLENIADADVHAMYMAFASADVTEAAAAHKVALCMMHKVVLCMMFDKGEVICDASWRRRLWAISSSPTACRSPSRSRERRLPIRPRWASISRTPGTSSCPAIWAAWLAGALPFQNPAAVDTRLMPNFDRALQVDGRPEVLISPRQKRYFVIRVS